MYLTYSSSSSAEILVAEYQPKVIKTDKENEHAIALAEKESNPHSMLLHLMEARNLKETDLVEILGSSTTRRRYAYLFPRTHAPRGCEGH